MHYHKAERENKINELNNDFILPLENFEWNSLSINANTSVYLRVEELKKIKDYKNCYCNYCSYFEYY